MRNFKSARSDSMQSALDDPYELTFLQLTKPDRLQQLYKEYIKEQKDFLAGKEKPIPKLDSLPKNYIRVNENIVFRSTPRYIAIIEKIQKENGSNASDPVWLLQETLGKIQKRDRQLIEKNIKLLLEQKYRVNGRVTKSFKYSEIFIIYRPFEEKLPEGTVRLTQLWAVRAVESWIQNFGSTLEDRKNLRNGYTDADRTATIDYLNQIALYKDETSEEALQSILDIVVQMCNKWSIGVPLNTDGEPDLEIFPIPSINDDLYQLIFINQYIQIDNILKDASVLANVDQFEYSNLILRLQEARDALALKIKIADFTNREIKPLVYFEDYDFQPPDLQVKIDIWEGQMRERSIEKLRVREPMTAAGVLAAKGKKTSGRLAVFDINGPVPDKLRKAVKSRLDDLGIGFIEEAFYGAYGDNISNYVLAIAEISNNSERSPEFKERLLAGDLGQNGDLLFIERKDILPQFYTNEKLLANRRDFGRLERIMDDRRNEEANLFLHNWQPSVKKEWFPVSISPTNFDFEKWQVDPSGASCGINRIYVMTAEGIRCLTKDAIRQRLDELLPLNRKDLENLLGFNSANSSE